LQQRFSPSSQGQPWAALSQHKSGIQLLIGNSWLAVLAFAFQYLPEGLMDLMFFGLCFRHYVESLSVLEFYNNPRIDSKESIPGLLESSQIRALIYRTPLVGLYIFSFSVMGQVK
jgi:hypothetical protein